MSITRVLRQRETATSYESRSVLQAAMMRDVVVEQVGLQDLPSRRLSLSAGTVLPVGSVEFVRAAMALAGISEPASMSYPTVVADHLMRDVRRSTVGDVLSSVRRAVFVKPVATKLFAGFVYRPGQPDLMSESDIVSLRQMQALRSCVPLWVSEPVQFVSEWRYYVRHGRVVGSARYDQDGLDDALAPDPFMVEAGAMTMARHGGASIFAMDYGVLGDGRTALVEVNDFWALGLYKGALSSGDYFEMLCMRWQEMLKPKHATLVL